MTRALLAAFIYLGLSPVQAQEPDREVAPFEVASIHEMSAPFRVMGMREVSGTLIRYIGYTPRALIREALDLAPYQLDIPSALEQNSMDSIYEIHARSGGDIEADRPLTRRMLARLLRERFHLKTHQDLRELSVYRLIVKPGRQRLQPAAGTEQCSIHVSPLPDKVNYGYKFANCTIAHLVEVVNQRSLERPVLDGTQLKGSFDFYVKLKSGFRSAESDEALEVSLQSGLDAVGLDLQRSREKISVVVVDAIKRPSEN